MFSLVITITRALSNVWRGVRDPEFREMSVALILMLVVGTIFYMAVEGWSAVDSVYFCVMTLATIGYGDLCPTSTFSKIFTIIYFVVGAGIFVSFITKFAANRRPLPLPGRRGFRGKENP